MRAFARAFIGSRMFPLYKYRIWSKELYKYGDYATWCTYANTSKGRDICGKHSTHLPHGFRKSYWFAENWIGLQHTFCANRLTHVCIMSSSSYNIPRKSQAPTSFPMLLALHLCINTVHALPWSYTAECSQILVKVFYWISPCGLMYWCLSLWAAWPWTFEAISKQPT